MKRESVLRIQDIQEYVEKILSSTKDCTEKQFVDNIVLQSAVIRWLEILGEAAKYVPQEIKSKYPNIPWKEMAAMRDVAIHDYAELIPEDIWKTVVNDIPQLKKEIDRAVFILLVADR